MGYKTLLFYIDDTLLDFKKDQRFAISTALSLIGVECTDELYNSYNQINNELWSLLNEGKITLQEVLIKRFEIFFDKHEILESPLKFKELVSQGFKQSGNLISGVEQLFLKLYGKYELVIASNGPKSEQVPRLKNANLYKYFSKIFVSEEIGVNKPDKKFFDIIFNQIENKHKSSILMIGDDLTTDIQGAINAGIDSCWFNYKDKSVNSKIIPTFSIKSYNELINLLCM